MEQMATDKSYVRVQVPIFEEFVVKVPKFVEQEIKVPVGWDKVINELALEITKQIQNNLSGIEANLLKAIDARMKEIEVPRITYKDELRVVLKDVEVLNPVLKDVAITNAIITDKLVTNAIIRDVPVIKPIFEEVLVKSFITA